jgi:Zn-dependent alcohol dehydrogenase
MLAQCSPLGATETTNMAAENDPAHGNQSNTWTSTPTSLGAVGEGSNMEEQVSTERRRGKRRILELINPARDGRTCTPLKMQVT